MKKTGILIIVLIVALAAVGSGYALWTQNLDITATATSGNFGAAFVLTNPDEFGVESGTGSNGIAYSATLNTGSLNVNDILALSITGMYPGGQLVVPITVQNTGTVPISSISVTDTSAAQDANYGITISTNNYTSPVAPGATTSGWTVTITMDNPAGIDNTSQNIPSIIVALGLTAVQ
jgi:hypothetical protein